MSTYTVADDGVISITDDLSDDEILDMYSSGFFIAVFKTSIDELEYAEINETTREVEWIKAVQAYAQEE